MHRSLIFFGIEYALKKFSSKSAAKSFFDDHITFIVHFIEIIQQRMFHLTCYSCDYPKILLARKDHSFEYIIFQLHNFFLFFVKFSPQFMFGNEDSPNIFIADGHTIGQKYEALSN